MNVLAVDTTSEKLIAALSYKGRRFTSVVDTGKSGHSKNLLPVIDALIREAGADIGETDAVAAVVGPGSFTGIRIGVSALTAISYATGAKRIAVTSFELIAYNRAKITARVDAGHGNLYIAECENGRVISTDFIAARDAENAAEFVDNSLEPPELTLCRIAEDKAKGGEFTSVLEPYYMRSSQAERNGAK